MKQVFYPTFLAFHCVFVTFDNEFKIIKYICAFLLFLYLIGKRKQIFKSEYKTMNVILLLFSISVIISSVKILYLHLPGGFAELSPLSGLLFACCVLNIFFFLEYLNETNKVKSFLIITYRLLLIYLIVNDIGLLLLQRPSVSGMESSSIIYLIGNKFEVSYKHIFFAAIYYEVKFVFNSKPKNIEKLTFVFLMFITIIVPVLVECSTAVIGSLAFVAFLLLYRRIKLIYTPLGVLCLFILFGSFFVCFQFFLDIPFVQYVIEDILHEDLSLTGRAVVYIKMIDLLSIEPWFGYGNGSATFFAMYHINEGITNTQNGLLNNFIDWGAVGVILFLVLTLYVIKKCQYNQYVRNPFLCLCCTYIVMSSIEITLGLRFVAMLPLCLFYADNKLQKQLNCRNQELL